MLRSTLVVVALAASLHATAAFLPTSVHTLRAGSSRTGRAAMSSRSMPVFMAATTEPKERTVRAPVFDEICSETGVTLSRYMMELARENPELRDLESLVGGIQQVSSKSGAEFVLCVLSMSQILLLTRTVVTFNVFAN